MYLWVTSDCAGGVSERNLRSKVPVTVCHIDDWKENRVFVDHNDDD